MTNPYIPAFSRVFTSYITSHIRMLNYVTSSSGQRQSPDELHTQLNGSEVHQWRKNWLYDISIQFIRKRETYASIIIYSLGYA